jgi:mRNA-degrading endonuclease toxin of MazEF toxin-antitoxin module
VSLLQQGRIIWATMRDPNGQNPKERPAVIVTATAEIQSGHPIVVVAITGTLPNPLPSEYVELPWHRNKHPKTGLKKRCAAQCTWLCTLYESDIKEYAGVVPNAKMLAILAKIPRLASQPTPAPPNVPERGSAPSSPKGSESPREEAKPSTEKTERPNS